MSRFQRRQIGVRQLNRHILAQCSVPRRLRDVVVEWRRRLGDDEGLWRGETERGGGSVAGEQVVEGLEEDAEEVVGGRSVRELVEAKGVEGEACDIDDCGASGSAEIRAKKGRDGQSSPGQ